MGVSDLRDNVRWRAEFHRRGLQLTVLAGTRSDRRHLVERSGIDVRRCQAAIIFSFVIGNASKKVCIGVLPKHHRP
jgi:hypothetical protein